MTTTETLDTKSLIRLQMWLSPAFPIGSFAYSAGLERAAHDGVVEDRESLRAWILALMENGTVWNDQVLLAESFRLTKADELTDDLITHARAMAVSRERFDETIIQGDAFLEAAQSWTAYDRDRGKLPFPIAVGLVSAKLDIPLLACLSAYLQAFVTNQLQAAIRLSLVGQSTMLALASELEPNILASASRAAASTLDDLGSSSIVADIMSMKHETQKSRLFRS